MTTVDWIIVAFTVLLAVMGYGQGFIVGVLSLVGFALGALLGSRLAPLVLSGGARSQYAALFALLGALFAGGILASGFEGVGLRARALLSLPGLRAVDGLLGALLTAAVALGIAWVVGAVVLQASGSRNLRRDVQRSRILRALNAALPPSGGILNALARFDPLPSVRGPSADVPAPTTGILAAREVRAARASVVRILGTACGLGIEGSGWVAAPGIIVTNAHVVAGESDTTVEPFGRSPGLSARTLVFDPRNDIAVLAVDGLREPALRLAADPGSGTSAGILGYPQDGPYDAEPGRTGPTADIQTDDAYGNGPVTRSVESLRGRVRPGNSGGPMVAADGRVLGTVFAATTSASGALTDGGFAVPNAIVRGELASARARLGGSVSTGPCTSG